MCISYNITTLCNEQCQILYLLYLFVSCFIVVWWCLGLQQCCSIVLMLVFVHDGVLQGLQCSWIDFSILQCCLCEHSVTMLVCIVCVHCSTLTCTGCVAVYSTQLMYVELFLQLNYFLLDDDNISVPSTLLLDEQITDLAVDSPSGYVDCALYS